MERYVASRGIVSLVILDLVMPEMSGKKCLERLLKIDPKVKVIIASGYSASDDRDDTLQIGAKSFVSKPYDMRKFLQTVRHVLSAR